VLQKATRTMKKTTMRMKKRKNAPPKRPNRYGEDGAASPNEAG